MELVFQKLKSPVGGLYLVADETSLVGVLFENGWTAYKNSLPDRRATKGSSPILRRAERQLGEYFAGTRKIFELPLRVNGTPFQRDVWMELAKIPYGQTVSYREQAAAIGRPNAMRAVGGTNGRNLLSIVLPCHRVIGQNGKLTGYAGGIEKKKFLLQLEGVISNSTCAMSSR